MKLKLAKWCSIIPLFAYAPTAVLLAESNSVIGFLFACVAWFSLLLSVFAAPVLSVLGIVFSAILVSRKERRAMKFLVLSCADIITSALLALVWHTIVA